MVTTADLTDAEVKRIIGRLGSRQITMLRAMRERGVMRMTFANDQQVAESLANRGMPLLIQARSTFALTELGKRAAALLG